MVTRHSRPPIQFRFTVTALALAALALLSVLRGEPAAAQSVVPGRNVNMVSGTKWPTGDPYLQRQNEPSVAASTRNPLHLLAGANDYRTVDIPFVSGADETGDAWLGLFKSFDGGQRWQSNLIPGYPQDTTATGLASPLKGYLAGADPVVRAGANGLLYYSGLVFDRGTNAKSAVFVSRFIDNNNKENGDPIVYLGTSIIASDPGTSVRGNKIGTDPTGAFARPNAGEGLFIDYRAQGHVIGGLLPGEGNQVSGNTGAGIKIRGNATIVQGNLIGTGPDGLAALPNGSMGVHVEFGQHNTIGGAAAGSRNVISGNTGPGVLIGGLTSYLPTPSTANTIAGNYIGLSATGAAPLPNGAEGINLRESAGGTIVQDNVVSASTGFGITLFDGTSGNTIRHNWIGTDPAGAIVAGFGNAAGGVGLWNAATGNTIGGATAADGNVIAGNGGPGIAVLATGATASTGGSFLANSIVGNAGLGIDLGGDGVTANDPSDGDAGPNRLQNAPVLLGIANSPTETQVGFSINSVPLKTYTLEFFASSACDPSGRGQGQRPVARTTAATNFFGNAGGTLLMPELLAPGTIVTATATDDAGNTSEFSNCAVLVDVPGTAGGTANVNFPGGVSAAGGTDPVNSGIFVNAGGQVTISATGSVDFGGLIYGPNGSGGGTARPEFLATSASEWSLVGRIGSGPWQAIGAGPTTLTAGSAGALQLATNDRWYGDPNTGDFFAAVAFGAAAGGSPIFTTAGVGNLGHNDFPPIDCGPGSYGVALRGRAGDDIDQTHLWCSPLSGGALGAATLAGSVGGGSDYGATLSCPANSVMTGIHGMAGQVIWGGTVVDSLGVTCTDLSTGTIVTSPTVGLETPLSPGSTTPYAISCPAGMAVAGIAGGQGGLLDWIGLRCR